MDPFSKEPLEARMTELAAFKPSVNSPSPSRLPNGTELDDLLAVAAGSVPACTVEGENPYPWRSLIEFLRQKGVIVKAVRVWDEERWGYEIVASRDPDRVTKLSRLHTDRPSMFDFEYYRQMGDGLGYPKEAIEEFVDRVATGAVIPSSIDEFLNSSSDAKANSRLIGPNPVFERIMANGLSEQTQR